MHAILRFRTWRCGVSSPGRAQSSIRPDESTTTPGLCNSGKLLAKTSVTAQKGSNVVKSSFSRATLKPCAFEDNESCRFWTSHCTTTTQSSVKFQIQTMQGLLGFFHASTRMFTACSRSSRRSEDNAIPGLQGGITRGLSLDRNLSRRNWLTVSTNSKEPSADIRMRSDGRGWV